MEQGQSEGEKQGSNSGQLLESKCLSVYHISLHILGMKNTYREHILGWKTN